MASTPDTASAEAVKRDVLLPDDEEKKPGEPEKKKRRLQLRIDHDPDLKKILTSVVGTVAHKFNDGLMYESTLEALREMWKKMDFVENSVLKQINFQSVRGVDPAWEQLLEACDVGGDGHITPSDFVAGFVFEALDKPLAVNFGPGTTVTGIDVMKSLQAVLNEHIMNEMENFKRNMGW